MMPRLPLSLSNKTPMLVLRCNDNYLLMSMTTMILIHGYIVKLYEYLFFPFVQEFSRSANWNRNAEWLSQSSPGNGELALPNDNKSMKISLAKRRSKTTKRSSDTGTYLTVICSFMLIGYANNPLIMVKTCNGCK
jgi:hypothetical protein